MKTSITNLTMIHESMSKLCNVTFYNFSAIILTWSFFVFHELSRANDSFQLLWLIKNYALSSEALTPAKTNKIVLDPKIPLILNNCLVWLFLVKSSTWKTISNFAKKYRCLANKWIYVYWPKKNFFKLFWKSLNFFFIKNKIKFQLIRWS